MHVCIQTTAWLAKPSQAGKVPYSSPLAQALASDWLTGSLYIAPSCMRLPPSPPFPSTAYHWRKRFLSLFSLVTLAGFLAARRLLRHLVARQMGESILGRWEYLHCSVPPGLPALWGELETGEGVADHQPPLQDVHSVAVHPCRGAADVGQRGQAAASGLEISHLSQIHRIGSILSCLCGCCLLVGWFKAIS